MPWSKEPALMLALIPIFLYNVWRGQRGSGNFGYSGNEPPSRKLSGVVIGNYILAVDRGEEPPASRVIQRPVHHGTDAECVPIQVVIIEASAIIPGVGANIF